MTPKVGDLVHITFWDHADCDISEQVPLLFECYGRLAEINKVHYRVATWNTPSRTDGNRYDNNSEFFSIIRGAVVRVRRLK
jgi:hypothetical protein